MAPAKYFREIPEDLRRGIPKQPPSYWAVDTDSPTFQDLQPLGRAAVTLVLELLQEHGDWALILRGNIRDGSLSTQHFGHMEGHLLVLEVDGRHAPMLLLPEYFAMLKPAAD